jgi:hypothetical protein
VHYTYYDVPEHQLSKRGGHRGPIVGIGGPGRRPQRDALAVGQPAWAKGLQRLYDEVVDEALPDDLAKLLDKLDRATDGK